MRIRAAVALLLLALTVGPAAAGDREECAERIADLVERARRTAPIVAFGLLLGAIAVAAAIAFGIGGRDLATDTLKKWKEQLES